MTRPVPKLFGWGFEGDDLTDDEQRMLRSRAAERYGPRDFDEVAVPSIGDIVLSRPRVELPAKLQSVATTADHERILHTYGMSFPEYIRILDKDFANAPDIVAYPESDSDIADIFDWASGANVAVIPFGGGTSVVGGLEPAVGDGYAGTLSLNLTRLDQVLEIDKTCRTARIQGGIRVPALEAALKSDGLTLRHFPQSMAMATLGGMIATRSGGHFATLYTHIDDFVESLRTVTPVGVMESRRLPGSGAGPSPDRLMIGSEGALGVITEAWMRLQDRPTFRAGGSIMFADYARAVEAVRIICQSGLYPSNVRLLDAGEAENNGFGDGKHAVLVLAFESADHPLDPWMERATEICRDHDGVPEGEMAGDSHREGSAGAWRHAFIRMPHYRSLTIRMGMISDTFETAITWDRFPSFHENVMAATRAAIEEATGQPGTVTCRFTHCYPDGPAPYYSFQALGRHGQLSEQWLHIKSKGLDAAVDNGGTVTHHHAVGRDHMPWYRRQRPELFGAALRGAKKELDPAGILNPGVVV